MNKTVNLLRKVKRVLRYCAYKALNFFRIRQYPSNMEVVFKSPPLTEDALKAIKLIAPHFGSLSCDEQSRQIWEKDQNSTSWGEYIALSKYLENIPKPAKILDIGPGLGRSIVFFKKKLGWDNTEFHLYEGSGEKTKYYLQGPRFDDSFCGNIPVLEKTLLFNGVKNFRVFDARSIDARLSSLPGPYDFIYSFFAVGFHWSLKYFLGEIMQLMHKKTLMACTVPNNFVSFKELTQLNCRIIDWHAFLYPERTQSILIMSRNKSTVYPSLQRKIRHH